MTRISAVAFNTFREAVRDRVLYNLIFFALLLVGAALLFGQISIGIQRIVLINLGLTAISVFGVAIAIFMDTSGEHVFHGGRIFRRPALAGSPLPTR
jgi:hypothetical protein